MLKPTPSQTHYDDTANKTKQYDRHKKYNINMGFGDTIIDDSFRHDIRVPTRKQKNNSKKKKTNKNEGEINKCGNIILYSKISI